MCIHTILNRVLITDFQSLKKSINAKLAHLTKYNPFLPMAHQLFAPLLYVAYNLHFSAVTSHILCYAKVS